MASERRMLDLISRQRGTSTTLINSLLSPQMSKRSRSSSSRSDYSGTDKPRTLPLFWFYPI